MNKDLETRRYLRLLRNLAARGGEERVDALNRIENVLGIPPTYEPEPDQETHPVNDEPG